MIAQVQLFKRVVYKKLISIFFFVKETKINKKIFQSAKTHLTGTMKGMRRILTFVFIFTFSSRLVSSGTLTEKCGPPTLLPDWDNVTAVAGSRAILTCPLDTFNSCLVDLVSIFKKFV